MGLQDVFQTSGERYRWLPHHFGLHDNHSCYMALAGFTLWSDWLFWLLNDLVKNSSKHKKWKEGAVERHASQPPLPARIERQEGEKKDRWLQGEQPKQQPSAPADRGCGH